jgi:hypothetical protein
MVNLGGVRRQGRGRKEARRREEGGRMEEGGRKVGGKRKERGREEGGKKGGRREEVNYVLVAAHLLGVDKTIAEQEKVSHLKIITRRKRGR